MVQMSRHASPDPRILRQWVETWRRAGVQLAEIRRAETASCDTQEAIRQIFGGLDREISGYDPPASGLIEQQAWFARLRLARHNQ